MTIGEAEYLEQRLDDQINWYSKKSSANQAAYKRLRLVEIIAAAAIPYIAYFRKGSKEINFCCIVSAISAMHRNVTGAA